MNSRIKFYLAVFAAGILVSGAILGVELGRRLTVTADFGGFTLTDEEKKAITAEGGTLDENGNFTPAGEVRPLEPITLTNYFEADSLQEVILKTIPNFLLGFVGLVAMGVFLVNALKYIFAAGNAETTGEAKTGMLYAGVGVAVVVLAYAVINTAKQLFGP